jgi:hypothetical protein
LRAQENSNAPNVKIGGKFAFLFGHPVDLKISWVRCDEIFRVWGAIPKVRRTLFDHEWLNNKKTEFSFAQKGMLPFLKK